RARRVGDAALEDAEVGAADVDQIARSPLRARRDREERHDQRDAERDAGGGEQRPHGPSQEVLPDESGPGHEPYLRYARPEMEPDRDAILGALAQVIDPELQ